MQIGFIGLGLMGIAIARNLAAAGHNVRAWNRSPVAEPPPRVGMVRSPDEVLLGDVVFTMLADDDAIREVLLTSGVLDRARRGLVHVCMATISTAFAEELSAVHQAAGLVYVSAPVFGRPDVAAAGQLNIVAAGPEDALAKVGPLFELIGRRTFVLGTQPKQANAAKVAGNMMIAMAIEALSEGIAITETHGVERQAFVDLMINTLFGCRAYENYGNKILAEEFEPGFRMVLGLKDLRLASEAAAPSGKTLPQLETVRARMSEAVDSGLGNEDWSSMSKLTLG